MILEQSIKVLQLIQDKIAYKFQESDTDYKELTTYNQAISGAISELLAAESLLDRFIEVYNKQLETIDLMTKYIDYNTYRDEEECEFEGVTKVCIHDCEKCISNHFENKAIQKNIFDMTTQEFENHLKENIDTLEPEKLLDELIQCGLKKDTNMENIMYKECSICGKNYNGYGNNAQPVNNGKCCDECNTNVVIPKRILEWKNKEEK